jgi:hypothetical protein
VDAVPHTLAINAQRVENSTQGAAKAGRASGTGHFDGTLMMSVSQSPRGENNGKYLEYGTVCA